MSRILIADDNPRDRELFGSFLQQEGYEIFYAETGPEALKQASKHNPDLLLLDICMPGVDGLEVCRHLRLDPLLAEVPIILVTGVAHDDTCLQGLEAGADEVLFKPVNMQELRARVRNVMRLNRFRKLVTERTSSERARIARESSYEAALEGWARALELRGVEPEGHTQRVTDMTMRLARALRVPEADLAPLRWGALLHDSGKCGIADSVLRKTRGLTESERDCLRRHPEYAYDLFCGTPGLQSAAQVPYCHHEHWDGSGYPRRLKDEEIPLSARIFAVADAWDILTSPPPCGKGWTHAFARQQIADQSGKRFDPSVVAAFQQVLAPEDLVEYDPTTAATPARDAAWTDERARRPAAFSLSSRGARLHFFAALMLISVIPTLAFLYLALRGFIGSETGWSTLAPLAGVVVLLMGLGYGLLARYPASVIRLRRWVEGLAKGDLPMRIELSTDENDLVAIERCLREVVRQSQERIRKLEQQTEALLVAERQRVAIEGLGAACHHLGQPATTLLIALHMLRNENPSPGAIPLLDQCQQAAESLAQILQKLQNIASYRTEPYLSATPEFPASENQMILQL
jgi:putative two-component system response regulator